MAKLELIKLTSSNTHKKVRLFLGYINQYILDKQREELNQGYDSDKPCKRIIITTREALFGLDYILSYMRSEKIDLPSLRENQTHVETVLNFLSEKMNINGVTSCVEIAWSLLDALPKHHAEDNVYITTSFYVAEEKIPFLAPNATLVVDGHGGLSYIASGEYNKIEHKGMTQIVSDLIKADKLHRIDHCILQSCRTGRLDFDAIPAMNKKKREKTLGKSVVDIFSEGQYDNLFERKSLSTAFAEAISRNQRSDIAFSFSENLINPSPILGKGNFGVPAAGRNDEIIPWPTNMSDEHYDSAHVEDERVYWKRCTIVTNKEHRKFKFFQASNETAASSQQLDPDPEVASSVIK